MFGDNEDNGCSHVQPTALRGRSRESLCFARGCHVTRVTEGTCCAMVVASYAKKVYGISFFQFLFSAAVTLIALFTVLLKFFTCPFVIGQSGVIFLCLKPSYWVNRDIIAFEYWFIVCFRYTWYSENGKMLVQVVKLLVGLMSSTIENLE